MLLLPPHTVVVSSPIKNTKGKTYGEDLWKKCQLWTPMDVRVVELNKKLDINRSEDFSEFVATLAQFSETITSAQGLAISTSLIDGYNVIANMFQEIETQLGMMEAINVKSYLQFTQSPPRAFRDRAELIFSKVFDVLDRKNNKDHKLKIVNWESNKELTPNQWDDHRSGAKNEFEKVGPYLVPWGKEDGDRGNVGRKNYCSAQFSVFLYACQCAVLDVNIPQQYFDMFKYPMPGMPQRQPLVEYNSDRFTKFHWIQVVFVKTHREIMKQLNQKLFCELALIKLIQQEKGKTADNKKFRKVMNRADFDYNFETWPTAKHFFDGLEADKEKTGKKWKVSAKNALRSRASSLHPRLFTYIGMVLFKDMLDFFSYWGVDPDLPEKQGEVSLGSRKTLEEYLS